MPMVNKQLSMWAESLATLLMVHHYGRPTHALTELRRRLRRLHIHPNMYTFTHFSQTNAVYWKQRVELRPDLPRSVNPQSDVYIGSTSITYSGESTIVEPSCWVFNNFGNYDEFATWVVLTDPDHTVTRTQEHALISIYQPSLNCLPASVSPPDTQLPGVLLNNPGPTPLPSAPKKELHSLWPKFSSSGAQTQSGVVHHCPPHLGAH